MGAALLALIVANSPLSGAYFATLKTYVGPLNVEHWINDGLMAVFFLLVGLEIKREMLDGQLSTWPRRVLPGIAALGGMVAAGAHLCCDKCPQSPGPARMGDPHRHRHCLCAWRAVAARQQRAGLAEGLPHRACHHRRSRRRHHHRAVLYGRPVAALSRRRCAGAGPADRAQPHESAHARALCHAGTGALGAGAEIRRACHAGRRGAGAHHPAARLSRPGPRPRASPLAPPGARLAQGRAIRRYSGLRLRQCGRFLCRHEHVRR